MSAIDPSTKRTSSISLEHKKCYNIEVGKDTYIYVLQNTAGTSYYVYKIVLSQAKIKTSSWHLNGFPNGGNLGSTVKCRG